MKLSSIVISTAVMMFSVPAFAAGNLTDTVARIASEMNPSFTESAISEILDAEYALPAAPAPEAKDQKITGAALLYYPIDREITYEYEYISTDFIGSKRIVFRMANFSEKDSTAKVDVTIIKGNKTSKFHFSLSLKNDGIHASNSFLSGPRLEIPSSLYRGKTWIENGNKNWITSIKAKIEIPAGKFTDCVKVKTRIGNGDAGKAVRYYARGLGLVYEEWEAEDRSDILRLISYKVK